MGDYWHGMNAWHSKNDELQWKSYKDRYYDIVDQFSKVGKTEITIGKEQEMGVYDYVVVSLNEDGEYASIVAEGRVVAKGADSARTKAILKAKGLEKINPDEVEVLVRSFR